MRRRPDAPKYRTSRTILAASAIIAVAIVGTAAWISWRDYQDIRRDMIDNMHAHTQVVASNADRTLEAADLNLEMIAQRVSTTPWAELDDDRRIQLALNDAAARLPQVGEIWLIDQNGHLRALSGEPAPPRIDLFTRSYWRAHGIEIHPGSYLSAHLRDRLTDQPIGVLSRAIVISEHSFRGVAAASLTPDYYWPLLKPDEDCPGCRVSLVRADAQPVIQPDDWPEARLEPVAGVARRAIAQGNGVTRTHPAGLHAAASVISIRPLRSHDAAVVASLSEAAITARWRDRLLMPLGFSSGALLLLGVGAYKLSRAAAAQERHAQAAAVARAEAERQRAAEAEARQQAADANRAKSDFLAMMSHELRTPLNAILGFSEVIADKAFGRAAIDRYADYARDINRSGHHLLSLINDILDLSKIESGKFDLHPEPLDLTHIINGCIHLVQQRDDRARVPIHADVGAARIQADRRALRQILLNLLGNAAKFTEQGEIRVRTRQTSDGIEIVVADTGPGMDADAIRRAREPFGQVDMSLSRRHEGTGLGLPIVERLVGLHGGRIEIESAPGHGTTVRVLLPAPPEEVSDHAPAHAA
jgi:signal transduction histidine kinase